MKKAFLTLIKFYKRFISPLLKQSMGEACRFTPSCSDYAYQSIYKYGVAKGIMLSLKRLSRCHPFTKPAFDPVN